MIDQRMTSPTGHCNRCERPTTGDRRLCGQCAAGIPICTCGHSQTAHDLNPKGVRTRCSVLSGARGDACSCTGYVPEKRPAA